MTTLVLPPSVDPTGKLDVWEPLSAFLATAKPGDTIQNPHADATFLCDRTLELDQTNLRFMWEGATFKQRAVRPFGATRIDGVIAADGVHVSTKTPLPFSTNWGYVSGPGIPGNTEIVLDKDRLGGTLNHKSVPGTGLPLTFTSKQDRGRCGFDITGTDLAIHDASWEGPNPTGVYDQVLEAQHGCNFAGATNILLDNVNARHMFGDGMYLTSLNGKRTTHVQASDGVLDTNGRSGISPMDFADVAISRYRIDHVSRTIDDFEPSSPTYHADRFSLTDSYIGTHRLTLLSSGGNPGAHIGAVTLARNTIASAPLILWLIVGNGRGPFTIDSNHSTWTAPFGGSYPTAAMICAANLAGLTVRNNTNIILQPGRWPPMAFVRYKNCGIVTVHGNQVVGGLEVGPWI